MIPKSVPRFPLVLRYIKKDEPPLLIPLRWPWNFNVFMPIGKRSFSTIFIER